MSSTRPSVLRRPELRALAFAFLAILIALPLIQPEPVLGAASIQEGTAGLDDVDNRGGNVAPNATQQSIVRNLGATVRWNRFGTPQSLIKYGGYLGNVSGASAEAAARNWIAGKKALFRLSSVTDGNLVLLADSPMAGSNGHAVIFRQKFGSLPAAQDGMITVGITGSPSSGWKVAYVSSSAASTAGQPPGATLSPTAAWQRAANNVGAAPGAITNIRQIHSWTTFKVGGFHQPQRSRLVALPRPGRAPVAAYETNVLHNKGGQALAYTTFVDARSGAILYRTNRVAELQAGGPTSGFYSGTTSGPGLCGPDHPIEVNADTETITTTASADIPADDITIAIVENGVVVASEDTLFSPETVTYPGPVNENLTYASRVCEFENADPGFGYTGFYITSTAGTPDGIPYPPFWEYFEANPRLATRNQGTATPDNRVLACWDRLIGGNVSETSDNRPCEFELQNLASRVPWDHNVQSNTPTFTTIGNNAISAEAWFSPLTPAEQYRPVSPLREYVYDWDDKWNEAKCNPLALAPDPTVGANPASGANDIDAAITSLFSNHNRMHDWSYFLGFTEENFNLQQNNFGNGQPGPFPLGSENDPEIGNAQAGAVTGGPPTFLGRDNANQITLQDGIPGITNMYLWQPIASGFYPPCVDGDFDMSVIGHEYTHAISNRMVGGPDAGLSSSSDGQARAMGESYSDFTAVEYLMEYDYVPTDQENPFSVGAYVTGADETGIRNYGMNANSTSSPTFADNTNNPLNYSNIQGYDGLGSGSPHDDGEIWSAANYDIRQAMIQKYNGAFPAGNLTLQRRCADGELPADRCPGNRRWIQIVFDAYLLMQPAVSMLDSRDAYLAADLMRFGGANQTLLWEEFATHGFGQFANSAGTDDPQPRPSFESPRQGNETTLNFTARAINEGGDPVSATIFVGDYEANVTPAADTDPSTPLTNKIKLVPGRYNFVAQADGHGLFRFTRQVPASRNQSIALSMPTNWASLFRGATATDPGGTNNDELIDDTESSNWASLDNPPVPVDESNPTITVDLAGNQPKLVDSVTVSALLRAADPDRGNEEDPGSQNRFTALRKFAIETCIQGTASPCDDVTGAGFTNVFTSSNNAFPGDQPRPLAPELIFRNFNVDNSMATHVRLVVLENQCTGGPDYEDQDADPINNSDCKTGSSNANDVRVSELQVFSRSGDLGVPEDPIVATTMSAPATATAGSNITYTIGYENLGPKASSNAKITDELPDNVSFVSATGGGSYNASNSIVTWNLGTVGVGATGTRSLTVKVGGGVAAGTAIFNQAEFIAPLTVSTPAAATTLITE